MHPLISTADALAEVLPILRQQERIAIDTEADSLHSYFEKLCLIQISVPGHDMLVDPLAGFPLEPLFETFAGKELVFHGADYDLRLLRRVGFTRPARLFDTMIAARLCGVMEFSLAALISRYFGIQLTKASQKANWARRPLSPQMSEYAVNDTRFLLQLADIFQAELCRLGRWPWFEQSCERAITAAMVVKERDPEQLWRIPGSADLGNRASAVLRALWEWREQEAQAVDRPTFHILHNEQLIEAADRMDKGQRVDVEHLRGPRRQRFFQAGESALALPESDWPKAPPRRPRPPRPSPEQEERFRTFKKKRDETATNLQLDPALIAPKSVLERLAANPEETSTQLLPWQREALGV
jgi:ribonuclease D